MAIRGRTVAVSTAIALLALTAVPGAHSSPSKDDSLNAATSDYAPARVRPAEAPREDGAPATEAGRDVWLGVALIGLGVMMMVVERRRIGAQTTRASRVRCATTSRTQSQSGPVP